MEYMMANHSPWSPPVQNSDELPTTYASYRSASTPGHLFRSHHALSGQQMPFTSRFSVAAIPPIVRSNSLSWASDQTDLQPCWNIWGSPSQTHCVSQQPAAVQSPHQPVQPIQQQTQPIQHVLQAQQQIQVQQVQAQAQAQAQQAQAQQAQAQQAQAQQAQAQQAQQVQQAQQAQQAHQTQHQQAQQGHLAPLSPRSSIAHQSPLPTAASLWFGSPPTAKQPVIAAPIMVSPPLSPRTSADSLEVGPISSPTSPKTVSTGSDEPSASTANDPLLESYFDSPKSREELYEPVPGAGELDGVIAFVSTPLYLVKFKGGRLEVYTTSEKTVNSITAGSLVLVDADRGRDIGKVFAVDIPIEQAAYVKWKQYYARQQVLSQSTASKELFGPLTTCTPKHILRVAQPAEVRQLVAKRQEEAKAVRMCNQKAQERNLDMTVVDAEYQWDRRKLTFFYQAQQRVDFRDLVRDLFRTYKTRIWMCAVNTS